MNVLLLVVDSLRARSLKCAGGAGASTPFLDRLSHASVFFRRAYATECWTLPTHVSMFTGLLPSEHGAHFRAMAYREPSATAATLLSAAGYHTELVSRNPQFDGSMPGIDRGFRLNTRLLADTRWTGWPTRALFALQKPRLKRMIAAGGWFSLLQKGSREFLSTMARVAVPADTLVLDHLLERMTARRRRGERFFYFANLYDVHAPYAPSSRSFYASWLSRDGWAENLCLPYLCRVVAHEHLRRTFHMPRYARKALLRRYHRAIGLMDEKLEAFLEAATRGGVLEDTVVIVVGDHGEAFGEHGLYYHDASVYDTHLHVPLWVVHPTLAPAVVDDVVSTRGLFDVIARIALDGTVRDTILDPGARARSPLALAEHFHYPHVPGMRPCYAQDLAAAIVGRRKLILRSDGPVQYDLGADPDELQPEPAGVAAFEAACRRDGAPAEAVRAATEHLRRWERNGVAA